MSINFFPGSQESGRTPRLGTTARAVGQLTDDSGNPIQNASGLFTLWRGGVMVNENVTMSPDSARGKGWCSVLVSDTIFNARGSYRWQMRLISPDTTLVATIDGEFTL